MNKRQKKKMDKIMREELKEIEHEIFRNPKNSHLQTTVCIQNLKTTGNVGNGKPFVQHIYKIDDTDNFDMPELCKSGEGKEFKIE